MSLSYGKEMSLASKPQGYFRRISAVTSHSVQGIVSNRGVLTLQASGNGWIVLTNWKYSRSSG